MMIDVITSLGPIVTSLIFIGQDDASTVY
jgi:hypothetical protein